MPRFKVNCPSCGRRLRGATTDMLGDVGVCPHCRTEFTIQPTSRNPRGRVLLRTTIDSSGLGMRVIFHTEPRPLHWPDVCVGCTQPIVGQAHDQLRMTLPEKWGGAKVQVRLCQRCASRTTWRQIIAGGGTLLFAVAFALLCFGVGGNHPATRYGGAALAWLGIVISMLGLSDPRRIRYWTLETGGLAIQFSSRPFGRLFFAHNRAPDDKSADLRKPAVPHVYS